MSNAKSLTPGDMLRIPYGPAAIWGRLIHADARGTKLKRGLYLVVLDRDVAGGDDLEVISHSPRMLGPLQVTPELVKSGEWSVAGNVPLSKEEAALPYFEDARGIVDYFGVRVPETPENWACVVKELAFTPELIVEVVRAARGHAVWYPGYEALRAKKG